MLEKFDRTWNTNLNVRPNFWFGKKVLITGHSGFKGKWLSKTLKCLGATIFGISRRESHDSNGDSDFSKTDFSSDLDLELRGDLSDSDLLRKLGPDYAPEIVFHLAAQSIVRVGYEQPFRTFRDNFMTTLNLLEGCRKMPSVRSIVIVTTDRVYKNSDWFWPYRESDELGGYDPYSASKATVELLTRSYESSYFRPQHVGVGTARAGNVIGGGDAAVDRLVPDLVRSWTSRSTLTIRNPGYVRPWQHVLEALNGYLMLGQSLYETPEISGAYNFGPSTSDCISVEHLCELFKKYFALNVVFEINPGSLKEKRALLLDSSKSATVLGYKPKLNVESAVSWTANWYLQRVDGRSCEELVKNDIEEYFGLDK